MRQCVHVLIRYNVELLDVQSVGTVLNLVGTGWY
eukprot:SAG31_NODE_35486_length_322_cov_1.143498_1_plen_33_part_10